jgi:hypothetical protein
MRKKGRLGPRRSKERVYFPSAAAKLVKLLLSSSDHAACRYCFVKTDRRSWVAANHSAERISVRLPLRRYSDRLAPDQSKRKLCTAWVCFTCANAGISVEAEALAWLIRTSSALGEPKIGLNTGSFVPSLRSKLEILGLDVLPRFPQALIERRRRGSRQFCRRSMSKCASIRQCQRAPF